MFEDRVPGTPPGGLPPELTPDQRPLGIGPLGWFVFVCAVDYRVRNLYLTGNPAAQEQLLSTWGVSNYASQINLCLSRGQIQTQADDIKLSLREEYWSVAKQADQWAGFNTSDW